MNKKGFTLIEVMAVLIILGVILLIAVPAVSTYIVSSRKSNYYTTANSYVDTIIGYYDMKEFGSLLKKNEIMIVPIKDITLEKGGSNETPFGEIDYGKSYIVITYNGTKTSYYVNMYDSSGYGIFNVKSDNLSSKSVINDDTKTITDIKPLVSCTGGKFVLNNTVFTFNSKDYEATYFNTYGSSLDSDSCDENYDLPVIILKKIN